MQLLFVEEPGGLHVQPTTPYLVTTSCHACTETCLNPEIGRFLLPKMERLFPNSEHWLCTYLSFRKNVSRDLIGGGEADDHACRAGEFTKEVKLINITYYIL